MVGVHGGLVFAEVAAFSGGKASRLGRDRAKSASEEYRAMTRIALGVSG
jgi:hypothetical protein